MKTQLDSRGYDALGRRRWALMGLWYRFRVRRRQPKADEDEPLSIGQPVRRSILGGTRRAKYGDRWRLAVLYWTRHQAQTEVPHMAGKVRIDITYCVP